MDGNMGRFQTRLQDNHETKSHERKGIAIVVENNIKTRKQKFFKHWGTRRNHIYLN